MAKIKFTDPKLKHIKVGSKTTVYIDETTKNLSLRVYKSGNKVFYYRYHLNGYHNYRIGSYPTIGLKEARTIANDLRAKIDKRVNPKDELSIVEKERGKYVTFQIVCEKFIDYHFPKLKEKTQKDYLWQINKYLIPHFGDKELKTLERREISDFLDAICSNHGVLSNRLHSTLSSIFSYAVNTGYLMTMNPILGMSKKYDEISRKRYYSEDEIRCLWSAFEEQNEPIQSYYKILLLCGQRKSQTAEMKWNDIDKDGIWTIQAEYVKKKKSSAEAHYIPLSDYALQLINALKKTTGNTPYVFANPNTGKRYDDFKKADARIRKISKIGDFRKHDLRRTLSTNMSRIYIDQYVIDRVFNHSTTSRNGISFVYNRDDFLAQKKEALQKWSDELKRIINI